MDDKQSICQQRWRNIVVNLMSFCCNKYFAQIYIHVLTKLNSAIQSFTNR